MGILGYFPCFQALPKTHHDCGVSVVHEHVCHEVVSHKNHMFVQCMWVS